jgi:SHS2 domain-containing protein
VYRWVDHTSEVELELEAASEPEVFADALTALAELHEFGATGTTELDEHRTVTVCAGEAADWAAVLVGWLEELVLAAESEGFVALAVVSLELRRGGLTAEVAGVLGDPAPLVKAVTLHRLRFEPGGSGYVARVVLDV